MNEIIHIGFSKCASTFLQSLFSEVDGINYIYKSKRYSLLNENKKDIRLNKQLINLESDEHIVLPCYNHELNTHGTMLNTLELVLDNIYNKNPNTKLILVIREHKDLILSRYSQYVIGGGKETINDFVDILLGIGNTQQNYFQNYYYEIISLIERKFSKENLKVIIYEELKNSKDEIVLSLADYIGVYLVPKESNIKSHRKGLSKSGLEILRLLNKVLIKEKKNIYDEYNAYIPAYFYKILVKIIRVFDYNMSPKKYKLLASQSKYINELFAEDNIKLAKWFNKDLKKYGYGA
tara:strand:- start:4193 stop:5071 length:879 start_codon:yes stop_codon:yes gene_type:complete